MTLREKVDEFLASFPEERDREAMAAVAQDYRQDAETLRVEARRLRLAGEETTARMLEVARWGLIGIAARIEREVRGI